MSGCHDTNINHQCTHGNNYEFCNFCYKPELNYQNSCAVEQISTRLLEDRIEKLESITGMLELMIKAKEFGAQMEVGNRYMECLSGLENKLQNQIDEAKQQFMSIYGKRPHKCPVCEGIPVKDNVRTQIMGFGKPWDICQACEGKGIVWG